MTEEERFWLKVDRDGPVMPGMKTKCWIWIPMKKKKRHGHFNIGYDVIQAHRYSKQLSSGKIPKGKIVMHRCDNPPCVRPGHLRIGTHQDNTDDMMKKGRNKIAYKVQPGEENGMAKLTTKDVKRIRSLFAKGKTTKQIAGIINKVTSKNIGYIVRRETWRHI